MNVFSEIRQATEAKTGKGLCPRCREQQTEIELIVQVRDKGVGSTAGRSVTKARALCGGCASEVFELLTDQLVELAKETQDAREPLPS